MEAFRVASAKENSENTVLHPWRNYRNIDTIKKLKSARVMVSSISIFYSPFSSVRMTNILWRMIVGYQTQSCSKSNFKYCTRGGARLEQINTSPGSCYPAINLPNVFFLVSV